MSLANFKLKSLKDKLNEQAVEAAKKLAESKQETEKGPKVVKNKGK